MPTQMPSTGLANLPFELLDAVVSNFDSVDSLYCLSLTCRRLDRYTRSCGYRAFCRSCFPCIPSSLDWEATLRKLTALSRAWTQKAFLARDLRPVRAGPESVCLLPMLGRGPDDNYLRSEIRPNQSMGYQPIIDCVSGQASDSATLLAWGAGSELVLRETNENRANLRWMFWQDPERLDGRDDITSLSFLGPAGSQTDQEYQMIVGRASRRLEHLTISNNGCIVRNIDTRGRDVRSIHASQGIKPIVAAGLDGDVVLYDLLSGPDPIEEASLTVRAGDHGVSSWNVQFLSSLRFALGRGPSTTPLCLFEITPSSILPGPNICSRAMDSVYAIEPLAASLDSGQLFLAGWYSGNITLHDLRMPETVVQKYEDPIDPGSAVYSLCSFANDNFVAGGGRHSCLKSFDLRFYGRRNYGSYNIFLDSSAHRTRPSPIYSIKKPSTYATSFSVGLEGRVIQLDLYSLTDEAARPDNLPLLAHGPDHLLWGNKERENEVKLALVEHTRSGAHSIWKQDLGSRRTALTGWDACWIRSTNDNPRLQSQYAGNSGWIRSRNSQRSFLS